MGGRTTKTRKLRELRLVVPDARAASVRKHIAEAVARLRRDCEFEALTWIERISEFDDDTTR